VRHRIRWENAAFLELFHFGKYIFISSGLGFLISSGDRAILGKFITLSELAVYNIAFFLATVPLVLSRQFAARIMLPLYSERPPAASKENRRSLAKARYLLTAAMFSICLFMALIGDWVVLFLYDDNYMLAGPILVLLGLAILPGILVASYDNLLISVGNSKDFTLLLLFMATTQTLALYIGITRFGMIGAVTAPILAQLLAYPLLVWMIRRYKAWDPMHDLIFAGIAIAGASLVLWVNDTALARVLAILPH
jgi:O-antigen/teichoic acid export membrane protein